MKKILSLLLALTFLVSLAACRNNEVSSNDNNDTSTNSTDIKHTGKKISGEITGASVFSDGLAFVCVDGNKEKTYCINEDGYIVFELEQKLVVNNTIYSKFINGLSLIPQGICNTEGKVTTPEEVGATSFYSIAFEGGYILAEKITSDYSSSKKELGVLNKNFEWIVPLSEDLYSSVENSLSGLTSIDSKSFYSNDYIYFENTKNYLDLKNGTIAETANIPFPSNAWKTFSDNTFRDNNGNTILDLNKHDNIILLSGSRFNNKKAPVKFYNPDTNTNFFTLIDESGNFLFEPVATNNNMSIADFNFDGETTLIINSTMGVDTIQSYNSNGELLGQLNTDTLGNMSYHCDISDGIIVVRGGLNNSKRCYYYNNDFTPLF